MTENEAIKKLNMLDEALNFQRHDADECSCALQMAIQALEKQMPRKLYGNEWNPVHIGDTVSGFCPVCMTEFVCVTPRMYKANNYGYCKSCGQKLDWGE